MPDDVRSMWSEEELDRALAALNAGHQPDQQALAATRADLMSAPAAVPARRRWPRVAGAAAAVVALAAGVLMFQSGGENAPTAAAAALNTAADNITATDPPIEPGQYRYVATRAWSTWTMMTTNTDSRSALVEHLEEQWVPQDWHAEWLQLIGPTGNTEWLPNATEAERALGVSPEALGPTVELRAPCGDYHLVENGEVPCTQPGSWAVPTPEFFAGIPRDPDALYERLRADVHPRGEDHIAFYVADVLVTGLVPADLRASLYRVLARVPGIEITEDVANLAGKRGTAFAIIGGGGRRELIIDTETGAYIGERTILTEDSEGIPAGTVAAFTAVSSAVVNAIGEKPAG